MKNYYSAYENHIKCIWRYLYFGVIKAHSPCGRQGPQILVVWAPSYHCTNARQLNSFRGRLVTNLPQAPNSFLRS